MREKRNYMIITFHTTTEAMATEKVCTQKGIKGRLIPIPREISAGCGLAWRMTIEDFNDFHEKIEELDLKYDQMVELMI
nr:DUF3343 domain-containing protein [uncultured Niameybacter sp.]